MKICVFGLWHLGTVTAACLANAGHQVVGVDFEETVVNDLRSGKPPLFEPGLEELVNRGIANGNLSFTGLIAEAASSAEVIWVTYDTPVDENDIADVRYVQNQIEKLFPYLSPGSIVLISSQLPVGTTRYLGRACQRSRGIEVSFAYSPENLRLGKAIEVFTKPDRVVIGLQSRSDSVAQNILAELLAPFTSRIEWMSIESAEMTKHALNAFLATSIAFINEVASLCEEVGADAKEVQRGLKTEMRIGPHAYLNPGAAFSGGTLARDVAFLKEIGKRHGRLTTLVSAVETSNSEHRKWTQRKLQTMFGKLQDQVIAIWGLTYKPGTNTLRRSDSVELCRWLAAQGVHVQAHDPAVNELPHTLGQDLKLYESPIAALNDASALVLATPWPDYKSYGADAVVSKMKTPRVIDANRFLEDTLGRDERVWYAGIGKGSVDK